MLASPRSAQKDSPLPSLRKIPGNASWGMLAQANRRFKVSQMDVSLRQWIRNLYLGLAPYFRMPETTSWAELQRVLYWKEFDARRRVHERLWEPRFEALLKKTGEQMADAFRVTGHVSKTLNVIDGRFLPALRPMYKQLYLEVEKDFLTRIASTLKPVKGAKAEEEPGAYPDPYDPADWATIDPMDIPEMVSWNTATMGSRITQIAESTRNSIRRVIEDGLRNGTSIYDLVGRIANDNSFSRYRGYLIARTEVISSSNAATHFGIGKNIPADDTTKDWLATGDRRTRPTHMTAGGNQKDIPFATPFEVGGSKLMFPGDGSLGAPGREIIQCRCTSLYNYKPSTAKPKPKPDPVDPSPKPKPIPKPRIPKPKPEPKPKPSPVRKPKPITSEMTLEEIGADVRLSIESRLTPFLEEERAAQELIDEGKRMLLRGWNEFAHNKVAEGRAKLLAAQAKMRQEILDVLKVPKTGRQKIKLKASRGTALMQERAKEARAFIESITNDFYDRGAVPQNRWAGAFRKEGLEVTLKEDMKGRAFASPWEMRIHMGSTDATSIYVHEMGHVVEFWNPAMRESLDTLYKKRIIGEELKKLRDLHPGTNFRDDEVTYVDKWIGTYWGKWYETRGAGRMGDKYVYGELVSMGLQLLYENPAAFLRQDPELFDVIVGGLRRGRIPAPKLP